MSNFPPGCALSQYEVPSKVTGASSLKGVLMDEATEICKHCLDTRARGNELLCHPILIEVNPELPVPFLVIIEGQAVSITEP